MSRSTGLTDARIREYPNHRWRVELEIGEAKEFFAFDLEVPDEATSMQILSAFEEGFADLKVELRKMFAPIRVSAERWSGE